LLVQEENSFVPERINKSRFIHIFWLKLFEELNIHDYFHCWFFLVWVYFILSDIPWSKHRNNCKQPLPSDQLIAWVCILLFPWHYWVCTDLRTLSVLYSTWGFLILPLIFTPIKIWLDAYPLAITRLSLKLPIN
jgi:hypothetical protein